MFLLVLMVIFCILFVLHQQWAYDKEREEEFKKNKKKEKHKKEIVLFVKPMKNIIMMKWQN